VKFPLSGVVHSAANGIAGFISRIPIGITVLPTRVRGESSGRRDVLDWPAQKPQHFDTRKLLNLRSESLKFRLPKMNCFVDREVCD
jgi:hypothetical protein